MAKNMQPIAKRCKALGISPAVMGYAKKTTNRNPGSQMKRKKSEYGIQLAEKQKVKFIYGILKSSSMITMRRPLRLPARPVTTCSSPSSAVWTTSSIAWALR